MRSRGKGDEKIRELFSIWSDWREPPDESIRESFDVRAPVVSTPWQGEDQAFEFG